MNNLNEQYNKGLLEAVKEYLPKNINPAGFLMDTLHIERSAAYRQLRGEIHFTFEEASLIAKDLHFSLDMVVGKERVAQIIPYNLYVTEFETPREIDYKILEEYLSLIRLAQHDSASQLNISANFFPEHIFIQYENLLKFFLFKWRYYYNGNQSVKAYNDIRITGRMQQIFKELFNTYLEFKDTCFIFDKYVSQYLVNDLQYFSSIGLLDEDAKNAVREDVCKMLDYIENICLTGKYSNGNNVQMYISNLNFNKSFCTLKIFNHRYCIIEVCVLNGIASTDEWNYEMMNNWMMSRRKTSINITQCAELQRIEFFKEQRQILHSL